ncbi:MULTISPECIES: HK97 gp10 family phage protein [unclassified Bacillus cereus group]|uniref:HK97 gp10 family phage protein n=1 Tax=unclassified Bacillus cereus group TaxID=2750818 RepID=UPI001F581C33|nr:MULTISPECIES: HK97 gp10 family phage protein [unclassified Bacillus cereus group]
MNDFASELARELQRYANTVEEDLIESQEDLADEAINKLRQDSPKDTGKYSKGWRKKKDGKSIILYNALKPQLTHVLEKGHAKANGGRVPAKVHIRPVEEYVINELPKRIERTIGR